MADPIHQFFQLGSQYYVAGRYAAFAQLAPVVGNLLHHAVEMYVKGVLSKSISLKEMRVRLGHQLPSLWKELKEATNDPSLASFDPIVTELHRFEEIRYPDKTLEEGMSLLVDITKAGAAMAQIDSGRVPHYHLCLEAVDELVAALFRVGSRNPVAYLPRFPEASVRFAYQENSAFKDSA